MNVAPVRPKRAGKISESELQKGVIQLARRRGWRVAHFHTSQARPGHYVTPVSADGKGFPDLVLVRRERLIFAELKTEYKKPRPEQERWLDALREASPYGGFEVYVWKPSDWVQGRIDAVLR